MVSSAVKNVKDREFIHKERMKAIEMGQADLPQLQGNGNGAKSRKGRSATFYGAVWTGIGAGLLAGTFAVRSLVISVSGDADEGLDVTIIEYSSGRF